MAKKAFFAPQFLRLFIIPAFVVVAMVVALVVQVIFQSAPVVKGILVVAIVVGSWRLIWDTGKALVRKSFALDYIALLAIGTGVFTGEWWVAAVIVLMMSGGNTLEAFAQERAKRSLTALSNRIPHQVLVLQGKQQLPLLIESVPVGSLVLVRKGEVVPIDGVIESTAGIFDESSVTGEPYPVTRRQNDGVKSGVTNVGETVVIKTTVLDKHSSYRRIVQLVTEAQSGKTPFTQYADQLSGWFTFVTVLLAVITYVLTGDVSRVLAILVIATPCPLILAAPIAMIGGANALAQSRVILKQLSSLEVMAKVQAIIFDKTGTITFGVPSLEKIEVTNPSWDEKRVMAIAAGLERTSLHPYAKAILRTAHQQKISATPLEKIQEKIGQGIKGIHQGHTYQLGKSSRVDSTTVSLKENRSEIAIFHFSDQIKPASMRVLASLVDAGLQLHIFTGDTAERAKKTLSALPDTVTITADCTPLDKQRGIAQLKKKGLVTAMVGDGINDAPALAMADVGMVFSHQEQTAASEAADIVLLGGTFDAVLRTVTISRRTVFIAKQSMYLGLGLSLAGMALAAWGILPPLAGALSQEVIDVAVIINAVRAAFPAQIRKSL